MAANLAISFAQKGKRVILIDGDLKRPSQFLIFGLEMEDKSELGEFLKENADFKDVLKKIKIPTCCLSADETAILPLQRSFRDRSLAV